LSAASSAWAFEEKHPLMLAKKKKAPAIRIPKRRGLGEEDWGRV